MRLIVLELCLAIAAVVFLTMLAGIASHRRQSRGHGTLSRSALGDYLWAIIPWIMAAAAAWPAVSRIVAVGR